LKTLSAATAIHCFHKATVVLQAECENGHASESDVDMVTNWQPLCQKLDVEVELDNFIHVDKDVNCY
jgi:hypothetical protein